MLPESTLTGRTCGTRSSARGLLRAGLSEAATPRALATRRGAAPTSTAQTRSPANTLHPAGTTPATPLPPVACPAGSAGPGRPPSFPKENSPLPQRASREKRTREWALLMAGGPGSSAASSRGTTGQRWQLAGESAGPPGRMSARQALGPGQEPALAAVAPPTRGPGRGLGRAGSSEPAAEGRRPVLALGSPAYWGLRTFIAGRLQDRTCALFTIGETEAGACIEPLYCWESACTPALRSLAFACCL